MNEIDTSWRLRSWVRKRRPMMTTTPSAVIRRPASGRNRARVDASRFGERAASKRSCTGAVHIAATRLRDRLAGIAAAQLNARPEDLFFAGGRVFAAANPENSLSFARVAATDHCPSRHCGRPCSGARLCSEHPMPPTRSTAPPSISAGSRSRVGGSLVDVLAAGATARSIRLGTLLLIKMESDTKSSRSDPQHDYRNHGPLKHSKTCQHRFPPSLEFRTKHHRPRGGRRL